MNIKKNLVIAFFIFAVSSLAYGQTEAARTRFSLYGANFLSAGQTLRVTAQNQRFSDSEIIPCIRVRIVLDFYEAAGDGSVRLRSLRRVTRQIELDPGEAISFDVAAALACDGSVCPAARNGVFVSAAVFATPFGVETPERYQTKFTSTLAVREFGRTLLILPAVEKGFDPQPDPPASVSN
jgi:hypothetical protein